MKQENNAFFMLFELVNMKSYYCYVRVPFPYIKAETCWQGTLLWIIC